MSEPVKLRLDLPLVLPDVDDANDRCVTRLLDALSTCPDLPRHMSWAARAVRPRYASITTPQPFH